MKYHKIYDVLAKHPEIQIYDASYWRHYQKGYIDFG